MLCPSDFSQMSKGNSVEKGKSSVGGIRTIGYLSAKKSPSISALQHIQKLCQPGS
jgi:hypothetical protein